MRTTIRKEAFTTELFDLLRETFEETQGIFLDQYTSLFETIDVLSHEQASQPIAPSGATIAGHVEHIAFYLGVLTNCIQRKPAVPIDWEVSWKVRDVDADAWMAAKRRLRDAYQTTLEEMRNLEQWEGEDDIGASLAILAHTASHLGAIRQALHLVVTRA